MHERMSARDRARVGVIAGVAVLSALALPLTAPAASWAEEPDGTRASAAPAAVAASAEPPTADGAPAAPSVEAAPADPAAEREAQPSAGGSPEQGTRPSPQEPPVEEAPEEELLSGTSADARQAEPAHADAAAPEAAPAPIEPVDPPPAIRTPVPASDASAVGPAAPTAVPAPQITCLSSAFYAVTNDGVVQQVIDGAGTNDASFVPVGSWSLESPTVDGLGVAAGGAAIYAVDVTRSGVDHVLAYTAAGGWTAVPSSFEHGNTEPLVAGAVDLASGRYYVGGYHVADRTAISFRVYSVDVDTGELALVGQLPTGLRPNDLSRGDMAFDAAGNLYVLHGSHDGGVVLTIAASELADPGPGAQLAASASVHLNLNGLNEGNGIAFTPRGTAYISDPHHVRQFVPGTWSTPDNLVTVLHGSTDLASCNAPATFVPVPGIEPGTPGQPGLPPVVGPVAGVEPGNPDQPVLPPIAVPVAGVDPGDPDQPVLPPIAAPVAGAEPGDAGQPVLPPIGGPLPGAELKRSQQPGQPPVLIAAPASVAEGPRPLTGSDERERDVAAQRNDVEMATLPATGGDRETSRMAAGGLLLGSLGLLLIRRRRATRA